MTDITAERERIGRALENGYLSKGEHRRIKRALDRLQAKRDRETEAAKRLIADKAARAGAREKLRSDLKQSLHGDAR